ncbi:MAG: periplasmic heavy metal sensor [Acidobacteria bacterium]|nr:periplasmic heavy metal sensor [Acidobacteriota bacterium]
MDLVNRLIKNRIFRNVFLPTIIVFGSTVITFGQHHPPGPRTDNADKPKEPGVVRQLGLSPDQIEQFRAVRKEWNDARQQAQRANREAVRQLDVAIYADIIDDVLVEQRLREVQETQAEMTRIRFAEEIAIRRILTPEQLTRFREARRRFVADREAKDKQHKERPPMPKPEPPRQP